jgi:hypothetical protein
MDEILSTHSAPHILLDHMMFTQALVNGLLPWRIDSGAIKVEHEIPELINAGLPASAKDRRASPGIRACIHVTRDEKPF